MRWPLTGPALMAAILVAACKPAPGDGDPQDSTVITLPEPMQGDQAAGPAPDAAGTPMAERVATVAVLNKRNNLSQDFEMKPGETQRLDNIEIRVEACERTAPWEMPSETGAFVQVSVRDRRQAGFRRIFSGWLFKNSPGLNVVEHPIYDVWVKDCAMSFPGDGSAPSAARSATTSPATPPEPVAPPTAAPEVVPSVTAPAAAPADTPEA